MSEHIVVILDPTQDMNETYWRLRATFPGLVLEPQFHTLPPEADKAAILSEMRRTVRFNVPSGKHASALVHALQADPGVEYAYLVPASEPARSL